MVKYDAKWEITNTYKNLQIVRSQFFTYKLIFMYVCLILNNLPLPNLYNSKGIYHQPDGVTTPKFKLLYFITTIFANWRIH
jgi:hypothetical protein